MKRIRFDKTSELSEVVNRLNNIIKESNLLGSNIVICGGIKTGRTTFAKAYIEECLNKLGDTARIAIVEDVREIKLESYAPKAKNLIFIPTDSLVQGCAKPVDISVITCAPEELNSTVENIIEENRSLVIVHLYRYNDALKGIQFTADIIY